MVLKEGGESLASSMSSLEISNNSRTSLVQDKPQPLGDCFQACDMSTTSHCGLCASSAEMVAICCGCYRYACWPCLSKHKCSTEMALLEVDSDLLDYLKSLTAELRERLSLIKDRYSDFLENLPKYDVNFFNNKTRLFKTFPLFLAQFFNRYSEENEFMLHEMDGIYRLETLKDCNFCTRVPGLLQKLEQFTSMLEELQQRTALKELKPLKRPIEEKHQELTKLFNEIALDAFVVAYLTDFEFRPPSFVTMEVLEPAEQNNNSLPKKRDNKLRPPPIAKPNFDNDLDHSGLGLVSPLLFYNQHANDISSGSGGIAAGILAGGDSLHKSYLEMPYSPFEVQNYDSSSLGGNPITPNYVLPSPLIQSVTPFGSSKPCTFDYSWQPFGDNPVLQRQRPPSMAIGSSYHDPSPIMPPVRYPMNNFAPYPMKPHLRRQKMIYHCKFGEFGHLKGQFAEPSGVAVTSNNEIIVADTNNHRIQIFDRDGNYRFDFGGCGKSDGQLLYPNRVAIIEDTGDIVVTERSPTHQVQIFTQYGQFIRKFGANVLQHPRGVCADNKRRIVVVECKVMRIVIFDYYGRVLNKIGCSRYLEFPNGVVVNNNEEIFISDNRAHCVMVFSYEGSLIKKIGGEGVTNFPIGIGINVMGQITVCDNHNNFNLTVFTQDGQLVNALESKVKHAQCFDVALMPDGSVVLASKDYRIYIYKYLCSSFPH